MTRSPAGIRATFRAALRAGRWWHALRSGAWARHARVRRVGAALLLFAFAIGSIVARDAALAERVREIRDAATVVDLVVAATFSATTTASAGTPKRTAAKLRPSGLSKRTAWSPTDPPDDDDETDDDSDSFAAGTPALPVDPAAAVGDACSIELRAWVTHVASVRSLRDEGRPRVRGPPSPEPSKAT